MNYAYLAEMDEAVFWKFWLMCNHSPAGELEMRKYLLKDFKGATRMAIMRASKWAPTWYVSANTSTFIYPDLIQRLAIKGIWNVSQNLSSGGSFQSSQ